MLVEAGKHVCNYVGLFAAFYALIVGDSGVKSEKKEEARGASRLSGTQIETVIKQRQPPLKNFYSVLLFKITLNIRTTITSSI